jgi:nucleotide-binding universal stress UspA family protein
MIAKDMTIETNSGQAGSGSEQLSRLLLPVDSLAAFERTLPLAEVLIRAMAVERKKVALLHVVSGSYLRDYMEGISVDKGDLPDTEQMKQLRRRHEENVVEPLMRQARVLLHKSSGIEQAATIIEHGDPIKVIGEVCREGSFSTVVMSRQNEAERGGKLTGSVTAGLLHRYAGSTFYLAGDRRADDDMFARCLIGVDDSSASRNAVIEAGTLLSKNLDAIDTLNLVHVLDQSCYYEEDGKSCMQTSVAGQKALEEAGNRLIDMGIPSGKITAVIHFGRPGTVLAEEALACQATSIFIGRRDRSRLAQTFLGSVCLDIIQSCRERTLVLAS